MSNVELSNENLIAVGLFSLVHRISETRVRKSPRDEEADNIQAIRNEANIYALLGDDDHIAPCVSTGPGMRHVDLKWAVNGTLEDYIKTKKDLVTDAFRLRTARWIIEAVQLIHTRGIIHSDLCLRQFLVYEDGLARLSDFAASGYKGHNALGVENASHYMPRDPEQPNSVESDLFALGSTLYELMAGKPPYHDKSDVEIESLYKQEEFPCIEDILCGELILRCWRREFKSADEVLAAFNDCVPLRREHPSKNQPPASTSLWTKLKAAILCWGKYQSKHLV